MNESKKSIWVLVTVVLIAGAGLFAQYRVARGSGPVHIKEAEFNSLIATMPEAQRQQYQNAAAKEQFAEEVKQVFSLSQEAERLGIANRPEVSYGQALQRDFTLAQIYRDRHRDLVVTEEQTQEYFDRHPGALDELLKYNPRLGPRTGAVDERIKKQLGEIETLAGRAAAEGIEKEPGVELQLRFTSAKMLRDTLLRELQSSVEVSETEIKGYFEEHQSKYEQVRASHILISTRPQPDVAGGATPPPPDKEAARKKVEGVLARVRAGEDFAALAKENSDDPGSKERGGDLNFFGRGQMVGEFERVAFNLQPGQVSDVVETPFGFHIIKVDQRRTSPLEQGIRAEITNVLRQQLVARRIKELEGRYAVTVDLPK
ncbi:MAG: peptidylprolyl isomerase [Acidobacteria bacterium]|nr:peptidylprolyl isomerase [Acidobacteriota bacterium]